MKGEALQRFLDSLAEPERVKRVHPFSFCGSVHRVNLDDQGLHIIVYREEDEIWGNHELTNQDIDDAALDVQPVDGRAVIEAVMNLPRVVQVQFINARGCGTIISRR